MLELDLLLLLLGQLFMIPHCFYRQLDLYPNLLAYRNNGGSGNAGPGTPMNVSIENLISYRLTHKKQNTGKWEGTAPTMAKGICLEIIIWGFNLNL